MTTTESASQLQHKMIQHLLWSSRRLCRYPFTPRNLMPTSRHGGAVSGFWTAFQAFTARTKRGLGQLIWLEPWDVRSLELPKNQCSSFQVHQQKGRWQVTQFSFRKSFPKSAYMGPHAYTTLAPISQTLEHAGPPLPLWPWELTAVCMCQLCSLDVCLSVHFDFLIFSLDLPKSSPHAILTRKTTVNDDLQGFC